MSYHSEPQVPPDAVPGPLAGLRVLELGTLIAGPFAGRWLADFGAEVIKIEHPAHGDPMRKWGRSWDGTDSLWHLVQSRGKRSVAADLHDPRDQATSSDGWPSRATSSSRTSGQAGWNAGTSIPPISWRTIQR